MTTFNAIVKALKSMPENRLEEVYAYIRSLRQSGIAPEKNQEKEALGVGILEEMSDSDFQDFLQHTEDVRQNLFQRKEEL